MLRQRAKEGGKSREQMTAERDQKMYISNLLRENKTNIDGQWKEARDRKVGAFIITADHLTANGLLSDMEVATVIRRWMFDTYGDQLALDRYDGATGHIRFLVSESE
ncbi:hypothetical protein HY971_01750 [Candidatus Kaiserbacteria bacterium]|nr:hypothetical protein [Candidatus Kaiserbacteria bacterium]